MDVSWTPTPRVRRNHAAAYATQNRSTRFPRGRAWVRWFVSGCGFFSSPMCLFRYAFGARPRTTWTLSGHRVVVWVMVVGTSRARRCARTVGSGSGVVTTRIRVALMVCRATSTACTPRWPSRRESTMRRAVQVSRAHEWTSESRDVVSGAAFSLRPRLGPAVLTELGNTPMLTRAELDHRSCPACYRPTFVDGYCRGCVESGAALRHRSHRHRVGF